MALGIGFGAERIGLAAIRRPKSSAALVLALLVLIGASLPNLRFDDDIHRVFLSDSPVSVAQIEYRAAQVPPTRMVLAYVEAKRALTVQDLGQLRDLTLDLEFLEGVSGVASPFALRLPPTRTAPQGAPVFGPEIAKNYAQDIAKFRALGTGLPSFLNTAQTALLIGVTIDLNQTSISEILLLIKSEFADALADTLAVTFTGEDAISLEIVTGLKRDLIALNFWGSLLVGFAALLLLRDLRMVVLAVVPALCGAASVLALSVWLGYPINVLSNVIPILLLVLGVADGVHLAGHLKSTRSARETVMQIGPACALTALSTALAFACIMVTRNEHLFEFAVLGALGTVLAFVLTITVFALLALVIQPSDRPTPQFTSGFATRLGAIGLRAPKAVIICGLVLLGVSVIGYQQTKAWFPMYQNLPRGSETVRANDAIARDFGGVFQMIVDVEGDWEKTRVLVGALQDVAGPEAVLSEVALARWLGDDTAQPSLESLNAVPSDLLAQVRPMSNVHRIFISVPEPMRDETALAKSDALYAVAKAGGAARIFGLPSVMRQEALSLISQLSRGLVLASLGATLIVAIAFRSARLFALLLVPNVLPLMVTGASLHIWASGQLSPTAVLALTISFGIAIDDTVHFMNRFFEARRQGETASSAVHFATRSAGQVMVLTTVLLTFGLAVTMISDFFPIRLFGGMMIITLWRALLFDLLLLPALFGAKEAGDA